MRHSRVVFISKNSVLSLIKSLYFCNILRKNRHRTTCYAKYFPGNFPMSWKFFYNTSEGLVQDEETCDDKSRSSLSQMFFKIGALKNFGNFTGKHLFYRTPPLAASTNLKHSQTFQNIFTLETFPYHKSLLISCLYTYYISKTCSQSLRKSGILN